MRTPLAATVAAALLLLAAPPPTAAWRSLAEPGAAATAPLVAVVGLLAWLIVGWLLMTGLLTAGGSLTGPVGAGCRAALHRVAPAAVRRAVAVALGLSVVLGAGGTARASSPPPSAHPVAAVSLDWPGVPAEVGPALDWPAAPSASGGAAAGPDRLADGRSVLVRPGDSLWRLAAEHLPAGAPATDIAAAWPSWWAANRDVLGDEPDLLHPGTHLAVPT